MIRTRGTFKLQLSLIFPFASRFFFLYIGFEYFYFLSNMLLRCIISLDSPQKKELFFISLRYTSKLDINKTYKSFTNINYKELIIKLTSVVFLNKKKYR